MHVDVLVEEEEEDNASSKMSNDREMLKVAGALSRTFGKAHLGFVRQARFSATLVLRARRAYVACMQCRQVFATMLHKRALHVIDAMSHGQHSLRCRIFGGDGVSV